MNILVTGGGGFLGSAICAQLISRGHKVVAYQRGHSDSLAKLGVQIVRGNITDQEQLQKALQGIDAVIHTAAKAGIWGRYRTYYQPNVAGTAILLAACRYLRIRKLVFTSSPSVVHGGGDIEGGDESLPYPKKFNSHYPATKALAEQQVMAANGPDLHTVSLRPHLIWGPGDNHLLPHLVARAKKGQLKLPGPDKLIDTIYIENAATAHLQALGKLITHPEIVGGKTYFISNDEPMAQRDIIGGLLKAAGLKVDIETISPRVAMIAGTVFEIIWKLFWLRSEPPITRWSAEHLSTAHWYDISAAKRDLGYEAEISIAKGLELLSASLNNQNSN